MNYSADFFLHRLSPVCSMTNQKFLLWISTHAEVQISYVIQHLFRFREKNEKMLIDKFWIANDKK